MPRTRNGSPTDKTQAKRQAPAKKKATPKRTTARRDPPPKKETPPAGESAPPDGEEKEPRRLNMVERVRVAERIVAARTKPKPDTWPVIAKREQIPMRTCHNIYDRYREDMMALTDSTGAPILTETLLLYTATIERLAVLSEYADNDAAKVGASRALLDALKGRIELLAVMGRMPRSFRAMDELALLQRLLRRMVEVVEKHELAPEVVADFLLIADEVSPVIDQRPRELTA